MPPIIQMLLSFYCGGGDRWCEVVVATAAVAAAVAEEEDSLAVVLLAVLLLWLVIDVALIGFVSWWRLTTVVVLNRCFLARPWFSVADGCFPMALMTGSAERPNFLAARSWECTEWEYWTIP